MRVLKSLTAAVGLVLAATCSPAIAVKPINADAAYSVARALELPYMKIYRGAVCREKEFEGRWYIKCSAQGSEIVGGLWAVAAGPVLVGVNGKAKQHADNLAPVIDNNLNNIPVREWADIYPNEFPNISEVLKAYQ